MNDQAETSNKEAPAIQAETEVVSVAKDLQEALGVYFISEGSALTRQGKVLKNMDRIESVNTRMEKRVIAHVRSWQVARMLRRDFNLFSSHLFFRMIKATIEEKRAIEQLIGEILAQATVLTFAVKEIPGVVIDETFDVETIPVRLVSRETSYLYRAITNLDEPLVRLESAYRRSVLSREEFREIVRPGREAYTDLRTVIFDSNWQLATESSINALR